MTLTALQRRILAVTALVGLVGPNGVFVYFALFRWNDLMAEHRHPVAAAFIAEAIAVMLLLAAMLAVRPIGRWGWRSFLALSMAGGLLFSIPAIVLLNEERR